LGDGGAGCGGVEGELVVVVVAVLSRLLGMMEVGR
jgi:hypothetical protein